MAICMYTCVVLSLAFLCAILGKTINPVGEKYSFVSIVDELELVVHSGGVLYTPSVVWIMYSPQP